MKIKIFVALSMIFTFSSAFATTAKYICPSPETVSVDNYDGSHWMISAAMDQDINGQINKVKIVTFMPINGCQKPKIKTFSQVFISRWPGGFNLVGCYYHSSAPSAPVLTTEKTFDPGKNCKATSTNTMECVI